MRTNALVRTSIAAFILAFLATAWGCAGSGDELQGLDRMHELYLETQYKVSHVTDFFDTLSEFDLENAQYIEDAQTAIRKSRDDVEELRNEMEELQGFEYGGEMRQLGMDMKEYCADVGNTLAELDEIYQPLLDILLALEPTLREEAEITQMDVPKTDAEFVVRITRITEALKETMQDLERVQVPERLKNYKLLMIEMFGALQRASNNLLALANGQTVNVDLDDNPDMDRYQQVYELNVPLLLDIKESLKIYNLEESMQRVEDDFYDLYLKASSEDEDKR